MEDLPFRAEYAKSGRAACRGCKSNIAKDVLRLAVMVQSPMFDGKTPQWYHDMCFFSKQRPKSVDDIAHFESLRWEDQQTIKTKVKASASGIVLPVKKGKKRDAAVALSNKALLKDFKLEYAKSGRAGCRGCEQKILKDEIRISKKDFETEVGMKYGGQDMWHHLQCFAKLRSELGYFESGESLPGFKILSKEDQKKVKTELPAIKQEEIPEKKIKSEDATDASSSGSKEEAEIKKQNKAMFKIRDQLKNRLHKKELQVLLEANDQEIPVGEEKMLDRLSDAMTFGSLLPCQVCKTGQLVFNKVGYVCTGNLTEWTKCQSVNKDPQRVAFKVPKELSAEFDFLARFKCKPGKRLFKESKPSSSAVAAVKKEEENGGPKVQREKPPLYDMEFVILGKPSKGKDILKKEIAKLGGKVVTKIQKSVMAVISTKGEVERMGARMEEVKDCDVHVVGQEFVEEAQKNNGKIPQLVLKSSICDWGSDPVQRLPKESDVQKSKSKSGSMYTKSMPTKSVLQLKGGSVVDPESGMDQVAHVYQLKGEKFTSVLGKTDIQNNKNSYYKIQLLESDKGNSYWVFRAWGRIGTTIGSTKLESMSSLHEAKRHFKALFEEKSGNMWEDRDDFVKIPGCMYPIDIDYGEDESMAVAKSGDETPSTLPKPVHELIEMIFNVDSMKNIMMEFELDLEKMPLGKLSKSQIQAAYKVLSELQSLMDKKDQPRALFIDASNRFYTFIPHSFGIDEPPVLDNPEMIKQKIDMLDALMEIEIAYSLHKSSSSKSGNHVENHYNQLNTEITVLERTSEEFTVIEEYVKNTHAHTHTSYKLEIDEVFVVRRQGEEKRYKPFKKLPNRKLLWHGSRTTNYAGILSQGLRIAPPEAPVTGYMFGKGIYFADMVSKSANYCCTTPNNPAGLLLLCEVALGEMYERKDAEYVEKLPKGKHSCKGVGMTAPDPAVVKKIHDGVEVPLGPGKKVDHKSSLLYNEYIVYDVAQVHCKYLLKLNFKYKY